MTIRTDFWMSLQKFFAIRTKIFSFPLAVDALYRKKKIICLMQSFFDCLDKVHILTIYISFLKTRKKSLLIALFSPYRNEIPIDKNRRYSALAESAPILVCWVNYFLMIASIAANPRSSFSLIKMYNSSPDFPLKKLTAA